MGFGEVVVAVVIIMAISRIMRTRIRAKHGIYHDRKGNAISAQISHDPDSDHLRDEVKYLKERVAVLEKIATDDRGARELENEIEKLRDR